MAAAANASTILSFEGNGTNGNIPNTFADNVPDVGGVTGVTVTNGQGTPNIDLTWAATGGAWQFYNTWDDGDHAAAQLDNSTAGKTYSLTFTPSGLFGIEITSLKLDVWNSDNTSYGIDWSVQRASDNVVMKSGGTGVQTTDQLVNVDFVATDNQAYKLVLTRNGGAAGGSSIAVDDLTFSQTAVPEPSGAVLAMIGLGTLMLRRRRK